MCSFREYQYSPENGLKSPVGGVGGSGTNKLCKASLEFPQVSFFGGGGSWKKSPLWYAYFWNYTIRMLKSICDLI